VRPTRSHYETSQQSFPSLLYLCRSLLWLFCPSFNQLLILVLFVFALLIHVHCIGLLYVTFCEYCHTGIVLLSSKRPLCKSRLVLIPPVYYPHTTPQSLGDAPRYSSIRRSEPCIAYYHLAVGCCAAPLSCSRSTIDASGAFAAGISSLLLPSFLTTLVSPLKPM